jgi:hypothetical protein
MLTYHISQSNSYTFRTEPTASTSNEFTMSLQDMFTLQNSTMSLSNITYNGYESMLGFTASISGAMVSSEYRATLYNATPSGAVDIWHGSVQCYQSGTLDKSVYENQIPPVISHASENKYIILK